MPDEELTYLIASFNRGAYVGDCLRSVLAQRDPRWFALVVDDASTDDSVERIRAVLDRRMRLMVNERNLGYIATLERLIAAATTDIVAVLDADDMLEPEATGALLDAFARVPSACLVYSRFAEYDASMTRCTAVHGGSLRAGGTAIVDGPVGAIRAFRRSGYARTGGLDPAMLYAEDRDLVYKLEELSQPVFVDAVLYRYRRLPDSHTGDPAKRRIGAANTYRARRLALVRRGVGGARRFAAELAIWGDHMSDAGRSAPLRAAAVLAAAAGTRLWRALGTDPRRRQAP